jgi:POT family proton-dependent oligopeptide transporter
VAKAKYPEESVEAVKSVYGVLMVFAFIPIFWAMWDQSLSEWVLQATKLDLNVFGFTLLPEQIQTVNPAFLLTMIPVFTYLIYPFFDRIGIKPTPLRRIGTGLFLTALSFVVIAMISRASTTAAVLRCGGRSWPTSSCRPVKPWCPLPAWNTPTPTPPSR